MAKDSEMRPSQRLISVIESVLQSDFGIALRVSLCDRQADGQYARYAGLTCAWDALVAEHYRTGIHPPMLLVGLFPPPISGGDLAPGIRAMLGWPGLTCLCYGFTKDELIATALRVAEGAKTPLPAKLMPTVSDVMRLTTDIRHWLKNRLRNTQGALNDFECAKRGEKQLHSSHLDSVAAISGQHSAMLNRLWALEVSVKHFAHHSDGLTPLKTAVADFENCWRALEAVRRALRLNENVRPKEDLAEAVLEYARVRDALQLAIDATCELDSEMMKPKVN